MPRDERSKPLSLVVRSWARTLDVGSGGSRSTSGLDMLLRARVPTVVVEVVVGALTLTPVGSDITGVFLP